MTDWGAKAVMRSKERQELNTLRIAKSLQDRETVNTKSPALWSRLCESIKDKVNEFNCEAGIVRRLGFTAKLGGFTLSCRDRRALIIATFGNDKVQVSGKNGVRYQAEWSIRVTADGLDIWLFDSEDYPADLETIAGDLIEHLLERADRE